MLATLNTQLEYIDAFLGSINKAQPKPLINSHDREKLTEKTSVWTPHAWSLLYVRQPLTV